MRRALMCLMLLQVPAGVVPADTVVLSNGQSVDCIVLEEREDALRLQVAWQGFMTIDRGMVRQLVRNEAHREWLLAQWRREADAAVERDRQERAFEAQQRASHLVKYRGQWITQDELEAIRDAQQRQDEQATEEAARQSARAEADALQERLRELNARMESLEAENRRLRDEMQRVHTGWTWRQPVVVVDPPRRSAGAGLVRDEHGNLLRLRRHGGHFSVTAPDGEHVDVERHGRHFVFEDEDGHHDLTPVR